MRVYETGDIDFFVDLPHSWERYCSYPPDKQWSHRNLKPVSSINYYRDFEGSHIDNMTRKNLYLGQKPKSRINPWACLPLLYATGTRFIKLEKAKPAGYKCSDFPININEARKKLAKIQLEELERKRKNYIKERFRYACKRESKFR